MPVEYHSRFMVSVYQSPYSLRAASPSGTGLEGDFRRPLLARGEHAAQIAAGFLHGALCHRLALDAVGPQQFRAAPPLDDGLQLPRQIDGVGDAGVHAEAAGRRHQMAGVAGQEDAVGAVAVGHQFASHPGHDRFDLEFERLAHGAHDQRADFAFRDFPLRLVADDRHPPPLRAVDRDDRQPGAFAADEDEAIGLALVMQRRKIAASEDHVGGVGQNRLALHGDAELFADDARRTVGSDQIVGDELVFLSGREIAKRCERRRLRPSSRSTSSVR